MTTQALTDKVRALPKKPGVYLFHGDGREVLYVGKARNLHSRAATYFQARGDGRFRIHSLRELIRDVEVIVTDTEKEALILEHTLIQRHLPRFNVRLKDDKSYLSVRIDPQDQWPRVQLVRRWRRDGALYFGPYSSSNDVRKTLRWIRRYFGLRSCTDPVFRSRTRPCLYYQIRECSGPCVDLIARDEYMKKVQEVILCLQGKHEDLLARLRREMMQASDSLEFERAATLRDQIRAIDKTFERQKVDRTGGGDRDLHAIHREGERVQVVVQFVREGTLVSSRSFPFRTELDDEDFVSHFLTQFYGSGRLIPSEVLVPVALRDQEVLAEWLTEKRGANVIVRNPRRGPKAEAIRMAAKTAEASFRDSVRSLEEKERAMLYLQRALGLRQLPRIMECYDISHTQGAHTTGSLVTFEEGFPVPGRYRRFRLRRKGPPDDIASMKEVIERRFRRALRDREFLPHLVVIDGGSGQLHAAREVLEDLGIERVDTIALAKGRDRRTAGSVRPGLGERIFAGDPASEIPLDEGTPEKRLLDAIRDEAHRFAVQYHRTLFRKKWIESPLEGLFGIGEKRRSMLLERFGTVKALRAAAPAEIEDVPGISAKMAREIHAYLRRDEGAETSRSELSEDDEPMYDV